ncbi:hypothetical protein AUI07_07900 [archaeon 13_2_20CM_2_53_6]|nr:MAG: hypothetical protein AUI07_07900 [archaeon 13_2_20CM_2_53_6]
MFRSTGTGTSLVMKPAPRFRGTTFMFQGATNCIYLETADRRHPDPTIMLLSEENSKPRPSTNPKKMRLSPDADRIT